MAAKAQVMRFDMMQFQPRFEYGDQAEVCELTGTTLGTRLGTGFGRFVNAEIPWKIRYDEVLLVLEGELSVRTDEGELRAGVRDAIWLPHGTALTYVAAHALVFYAINPANWAETRA